ncbi:MAG: hypothetical protein ACLFST_13275 [Spirochaetia bacterium]
MRTTIDIPDKLFKKIKIAASIKGMSMKQFITLAIEHEIETQRVSLSETVINFPLIHSKNPGSLSLDNETIAKALDEEDLYRTQS